MSADPHLTPAELQQARRDRRAQLIPSNPRKRTPGQRPWLVVLSGQPGSGKTTLQRLVHVALGEDEKAFLDGDEDVAVHPRYRALTREGGVRGFKTALEALPRDLFIKSQALLVAGEYDVVGSFPMAREEWAKDWVNRFRENGYRASVAYIATNDANSLLGLADRYQRDVDSKGGGRWADPANSDALYLEMPGTAQVLETEGMVDDIYVITRDGYVLYENHKDADGNWEREPAAAQVIQDERDRPPTPEAREHHDRTAYRLLDGRDPALPPLEDEVRQAVQEAVRREHARPEPLPDDRAWTAADRIDQHLIQVAQTSAADESSLGREADVRNAQRLADAGVAPAGLAPAGLAPSPTSDSSTLTRGTARNGLSRHTEPTHGRAADL